MCSEIACASAEEFITRLTKALDEAGKDPHGLTPLDLAPADQFHMRGAAAVQDVIDRLNLPASSHLLDVGCGLGGPARLLAAQSGCQVTGVDLDELSISAGQTLTSWTGQSDQVSLQAVDIDAVTAPIGGFDAAWTVHVGMFLKDKVAFYRAIAERLKPGAPFVIYDPVRMGADDHLYPVPWARCPEHNFIVTTDQLRADLDAAGFEIDQLISKAETCRTWFQKLIEAGKKRDRPSPLGMHLLVGSDFRQMSANAYKSLCAGTLDFVEVYAKRR